MKLFTFNEFIKEAYTAQGFSKSESENMADRAVIGIERHNDLLKNYATMGEMKFVQAVDGLTDDMTSKERGAKIAAEYPKKIAKSMETVFGDNPTEEQTAIIKKWSDLSEIKDPIEFEKASLEALSSMTSKMGGGKEMVHGVADLAESVVYMNLNMKGIRTELPASANFPVADVISFGTDLGDIDENDPNYAKLIALQGLPLLVSIEQQGGQSIKKDGGAASGASAKIDATTFKNKGKDGVPGTKDQLKGMIDNYENYVGQPSKESLNKAIDANEATEQWAKDQGILPKGWKPTIGSRPIKSETQWVKQQLKNAVEKAEENGWDTTGDSRALMKKQFKVWFNETALLAAIHNAEVKSQNYGNVNVKTGKNPKLEVTDGVNSASFMQPSLGYKFSKGENGKMQFRPNGIHQAQLKHAEYDPKKDKFKKSK